MRKLLNVAFALMAMTLVACGGDDPIPEPTPTPKPDTEQQENGLYPEVDGRVVVSYVTYYGSKIPDVKYMTHINYAFAELYVVDGVYQKFKLQGKESRFKSIVDLKKKKPSLKILLSFTHGTSNSDNEQGGGFSALAKSDADRKKFAQDCLDFCKKWGIDGIDMDWEFPGISWSGHACDKEVDVANHVLLMKQLRETLGDKYLLTYAGYVFDAQGSAEDKNWRYIDVKAVDPYVDWVNIMTYNMTSQAHSALNNPKLWVDCKRAVKHYTEKGVAPSKLVLGVPFFGYGEKTWSYKYIISDEVDKTKYKIDNWDSASSVPYVTEIATGERICAYDNAKSIGMKGDFARGAGLKGMMSWQYDQDDAKLTLNEAMWQSVMKK